MRNRAGSWVMGSFCMKTRILCVMVCFIFFGCKNFNGTEEYGVIETPAVIAERAYQFAVLYKDSDTEYAWGGQDHLRAIQLDCSGLIVMCYKYSIVDTRYQLLFNDASALDMCNKYSFVTSDPRRGDLVFMGEAESSTVSHVGVFEREEAGLVYFIDSTLKGDIDGVSLRSYPGDDRRIKSYGIMMLRVGQ